MLGGGSHTPHPADDQPPANSWAIWAPLSDAGEALFTLASNMISPPSQSAPLAQETHQPQKVPAASSSLPPAAPATLPQATAVAVVPQPPQVTLEAPPRSPSPALPQTFTGIASTHPYSTAFLMGATLTGSILAGAAAARVAMTQMGARGVRTAAGAAASATGSGGVGAGRAAGAGPGSGASPAAAAAVIGRSTAQSAQQASSCRGPSVVAGAPPPPRSANPINTSAAAAVAAHTVNSPLLSTPATEYDNRLARLESLVREMHIQQKGFLDTIISSHPRIAIRLTKIEESLAAQATAAGRGPGQQKQLEVRLSSFETLLRELHQRQKGFLDTIISAQPAISTRLGKIEEMLEAGAKERATIAKGSETNINNHNVEYFEAVNRIYEDFKEMLNDRFKGLDEALQKSRGASLGKKLKEDELMSTVMERLEKLDAELATISSHFTTPTTAKAQAEAVPAAPSINDLANEGFAAEAPPAPKDALKAAPTAAQGTQSTAAKAQEGFIAAAKAAAARNAAAAPGKHPLAPGAAAETSAAQKPVAEPAAATKPPMSPLPSTIKCEQPIPFIGVNDSGDWKFKLSGTHTHVEGTLYVHQQDVLLSRSARFRVSRHTPFWYEQASTYTVGPFSTAVVLVRDIDMIMLDGAWWRVSRDGDVYTVRERVGPAH